ncbi:conjugal transfer protein TraB [Elizabethkingia anophelis]|nr:conjugal transfer protein TraB [Elizabethkingia anophelis]
METNKKTAGANKKNKTYTAKFLKRHTMKGRGDKAIYVRPEYHKKLMHIVKIIGADEIPLYALLDNILKHHFDLFSEEILKDYNRKNKPLF